MACAKCGKKREIERQNSALPDNIETVTLDYIGTGSEKIFYNPNTGLVRKAGGKIRTVEVPRSELNFWLSLTRNNRRQFEVAKTVLATTEYSEQALEHPLESHRFLSNEQLLENETEQPLETTSFVLQEAEEHEQNGPKKRGRKKKEALNAEGDD